MTDERVSIARGETYRGQDGQHRFRVVAGNEQVIAWGEAYQDARDAATAVRALVDPIGFVLQCEGCSRFFGFAWDYDDAAATIRGEPCVCGAPGLRIEAVERGTPIVAGQADRSGD